MKVALGHERVAYWREESNAHQRVIFASEGRSKIRLMSEPITHHYYVDQRGTAWLNEWKYFRVTSISNMHIETCEIEFPSLKDIGPATQHPWIVGLASAWDIKGQHLVTLGIDQNNAILFGSVTYDEKGNFMPLKPPTPGPLKK